MTPRSKGAPTASHQGLIRGEVLCTFSQPRAVASYRLNPLSRTLGVGSRFWVAFLIPKEGCFYLCLSIGQDENVKQAHKASSLVLASAHGIARMLPSRRPALRRRISARQASETLGSSLPSMLSSRATTKAERWSVGRRRASSSRWSMRAFMESSLAARMPPVMHAGARTPNPSVISPAVVQRIQASHAFTASDA